MKARSIVVSLVVSLVLLAAVGAGGVMVGKRLQAKPDQDPARSVAKAAPAAKASGPVAPVAPAVMEVAPSDLGASETREVRRELPLTGQLRPIRQAFVRAKVAGEVLEMQVKEGEPTH